MVKQEYLIVALGVSIVSSIGGAVYSIVSGRKIARLEHELERRSEDIIKDLERHGDKVIKTTEETVAELNGRLRKKVDGIAESLDVDIPDEIVEAALKKAAEEAAEKSIDKTAKELLNEYGVSVRTEVRKSVDLAYANTKIDVKNELTKQIANVDISGIKREIIESAKEKVEEELEDAIETIKDTFEDELESAKDKATEKFEEELESISTRFSNDLERGSKIYKTISDKLGNV